MPEVSVEHGCMMRGGRAWVRKTARAATWFARFARGCWVPRVGPDAALLIERCGLCIPSACGLH
jgi:hypothetical protein